jgi:hypothetical protein
MDGVLLGDENLNAAVNKLNVLEYSGIALTGATHTLNFKINGSTSGDYYFALAGITLVRTA